MPVVGSVLVHDKQFPLVGDRVIEPAEGSSNTLLGFETTSPCPLVSGWGRPDCGSGDLVVAPLWWWGVVFDLWIVVASISHSRRRGPFGVGGVWCVDVQFFQ